MTRVLIGLGSNLGDREANLRRAAELLGQGTTILKISSLYETEPMYLEGQNWFINCVIEAETNLQPRDLLIYLKGIESRLGRTTGPRYGPRTIDLDILLYGSEIVRDGDLEIPHPMMNERLFVLIPVAEIEPDMIHPVYAKKISQLLSELGASKSVIKRGTLVPREHAPLNGTSDQVLAENH